MRDFLIFTTENGVGSITLKEVPYKGIAYIKIQSSQQPEAFLQRKCLPAYRQAGAREVLQIGLPKTVEVTVSVYSQRLVVLQNESDLGLAAGLEIMHLAALLGLQIDPFDEVLIRHGMVDGADVYLNQVVLYFHNGQVLFIAGFHRVGNEGLHFFAAAYEGNVGVLYLGSDVAAVITDIKHFFHVNDPPVNAALSGFSLLRLYYTHAETV